MLKAVVMVESEESRFSEMSAVLVAAGATGASDNVNGTGVPEEIVPAAVAG